MKKLMITALCSIFALSMAACGNDNSDSKTSSPSDDSIHDIDNTFDADNTRFDIADMDSSDIKRLGEAFCKYMIKFTGESDDQLAACIDQIAPSVIQFVTNLKGSNASQDKDKEDNAIVLDLNTVANIFCSRTYSTEADKPLSETAKLGCITELIEGAQKYPQCQPLHTKFYACASSLNDLNDHSIVCRSEALNAAICEYNSLFDDDKSNDFGVIPELYQAANTYCIKGIAELKVDGELDDEDENSIDENRLLCISEAIKEFGKFPQCQLQTAKLQSCLIALDHYDEDNMPCYSETKDAAYCMYASIYTDIAASDDDFKTKAAEVCSTSDTDKLNLCITDKASQILDQIFEEMNTSDDDDINEYQQNVSKYGEAMAEAMKALALIEKMHSSESWEGIFDYIHESAESYQIVKDEMPLCLDAANKLMGIIWFMTKDNHEEYSDLLSNAQDDFDQCVEQNYPDAK